ncbi:MAG: carbohydrate ABC transporter permease [Opitutales bacterium]|nr:carbohydrate ABC transporter permease [Opitutales bacterium]
MSFNIFHALVLAAAAVYGALWFLRSDHGASANTFLRYALILAASFLVLAPFAWLVAATFKDPDVLNEYVFFPPLSEWSSDTLNFKNLRVLFEPRQTSAGTFTFWLFIFNSLFLACTQTGLQLFTSSMAGFALAKYSFRGSGLVLGFILGSMMIPPILLLAPVYMIIVNLGWIDSFLALIVPSAVSGYGIFLFRQAMLGVPKELLEAARVEGASEFRLYFSVALPLVRPMSGAFCLVAFLASWNNFIAPNVFLHSTHKLTLPVILQQYVGDYSSQYGVFLAGTLIAILPPVILFFLLQREFISGLTSGAVKG